MAGFLAVVAYATGHDHPGTSPSNRGLLTIALAAVVIVLLTIHRTGGPRLLARAVAEYTVVALLAALLVLAGGVNQQATTPATPAAKTDAKQATAKPNLDGGEDRRPGVLRVAAGVARAVTSAIRAVTGAAGWVADLWRQADAKTDNPDRPPPTTAAAMPSSPALAPPSTRRPL